MPARNTTAEDPLDERLFVSREKAQDMLALSRNATDRLLDSGAIESRYVGRRRLVVLESLREFAKNLPTERSA